jgi:nucleoside-diphosphate-sugar epimerase
VAQAIDGEAIEVWGDGLATRSFCYIDDCIEGILRLMDSGHTLCFDSPPPFQNTTKPHCHAFVTAMSRQHPCRRVHLQNRMRRES